MHVLRNMVEAVKPGGLVLDLQVIRPNPTVEVDGQAVCEIDGEPLFRAADAATEAIDALVRSRTTGRAGGRRPRRAQALRQRCRARRRFRRQATHAARPRPAAASQARADRASCVSAVAFGVSRCADLWPAPRQLPVALVPLLVSDNRGMAVCDRCGTEIPAGARFCPGCAAPVADERPTEERKLATVLFADLVGSTALAGSQDPERTRVLLDRFYDAMTEEIERAGGTIEKFAGDAVMAAFGAPSALEDHAERALHAALAMQRRLAELFEGQLELRIGINTGEVVVGQARAGSSFVSGDAVNVAARLEQAAAPGAILVGERTVAAARGAFEFERASGGRSEGQAGGGCSATCCACALAHAAARRQRPRARVHWPGSGTRAPR